jgi:hypothetical protein
MASFEDNDLISGIVGKQITGMMIHNESPHIPGVDMVRITFHDNSALVLSSGGISSSGKPVFNVEHINDVTAPGQITP